MMQQRDINKILALIFLRRVIAYLLGLKYLNQLTKTTYADGSYIDYTYDAIGRLVYINDSISGMISYSYSNDGCSACGGVVDKVIQELTSLGSVNYEYNAIGNRVSMTVAGQPIVNYKYDAASRLTDIDAIINGTLQNFNIQYDAIGRRTTMTLSNGITTNYTYDNASRLLNLEHLNPLNAILEKVTYAYDKNGTRTSMNRLNVTPKLPNTASNITYNSANQMLTFNDKNITYDNNGNMETITNNCGTTTYTWNARNQLIGIQGYDALCAMLSASFKYDALGRRIQKTITHTDTSTDTMYLYDGLDIVQEIENGTVTVNYVRTLSIDEPLARIKSDGTIRYYQQDALGSVIALTDESGVIKTQCIYDPFGNTTAIGESSDNPFQFAGRENDGTGLLFERNRYLSFELQRYISQDPIGFAGGDVNFYSRVGNNPINRTDPFGLWNSGVPQPKQYKNECDFLKALEDFIVRQIQRERELIEWLRKQGVRSDNHQIRGVQYSIRNSETHLTVIRRMNKEKCDKPCS